MKMYLRNRQKGAAIFIALIMLLVMTIIGITASQTTTLEEKMAGNLRDQTLALQAAEAVLRATETWIDDKTSPPDADGSSCSSGCDTFIWNMDAPDLKLTSAAFWSGTQVRTNYAGLPTGSGQVAAQPKSVVELYQDCELDPKCLSGWNFYRVTANGTGGTTSAQSLLQTTFAVPFP